MTAQNLILILTSVLWKPKLVFTKQGERSR